jgi:hypothetical protein
LLTRAARNRRLTNLPILLLLAINLAGGLLTFRDFGVTWDEPLYYAYGENAPYAYSITARLNGDFDIQRSFEPSVEDHKRYGPVYLLVGRPVARLVAGLSGAPVSDGWHLVNFLCFQGTVWLVYALARRWVSPWAAFGAAALFSSQPVLWGHAFINPKDTPFTLMMLAALVSGLALGARIVALSPPAAASEPGLPPDLAVMLARREARWQRGRRRFLRPASALIVAGLLVVLLARPLGQAVAGLVAAAYAAPPESLLGQAFARIAANAGQVGLAAYQAKAVTLLGRIAAALGIIALALLPAFLWLWLAPKSARRLLAWMGAALSPLPTRPAFWLRGTPLRPLIIPLLLAGVLLGVATSLRILAPLAGLLVLLDFALRAERRSFAPLLAYALVAILTMLAVFPYLWASPLANFLDVLRHMSANPSPVPVVFGGVTYPSTGLPRGYLPVMLSITLSEPVWPLFLAGLAVAGRGVLRRRWEWRALTVVLLLFLLPLAYVLSLTPPMYDGYRHFLFMLPPVFVLAGFAFQALLDALKRRWLYALALAALLAPGIAGIATSHPYEYAYYNSLVGGTGGAFRRYDTDYWLTCYRDALRQVNAGESSPVRLYVYRQPLAAREYAAAQIDVQPYIPDETSPEPGSLVLLTTRSDSDLRYLPGLPEAYRVAHAGATFCVVRRVP